MFDEIFQDLKKVALAGVGAVVYVGEKASDVAAELVRKGEEAVEKAKAANEELHRKPTPSADNLADQASQLTPEERERLIAQLRDMDMPEPDAPAAPADAAAPEDPDDA